MQAGENKVAIKDDSASFTCYQEKKSTETIPEIDLTSDINAQFEITLDKLKAPTVNPKIKTPHERPTHLFINNNDTIYASNENEISQSTNKSISYHADNQTATIQATGNDCIKEKVSSLDVKNVAQYERLIDFPFTYECVVAR